ncbi:MAG: hypothetical protein IKJ28_01575, partial [Alphaproteobacteria bacterium]|nr:hypothetical protein [Alphaproteobacteria bacterium]
LVFYFDEEQAKNEPVKEQCGDIVCEQCQKCDKLTQKCYLVNQLVETLDDMACTTSDGSSGYCSMSDLGVCLEMGGASCPECHLNNNGKCEALDSSMYLQAGYGGYVCTKNGQDGYCINGACVIPEDSTICETGEYDAECMKRLNGVCVPIEGVVECTGEGYTGYCSLGKCYPSCDSCTDDQYCGDSIFTCTDIHSLICRDLDFSGYTIDGTTYYISNTPMTWWDNKDACDVLSKKVGKNLSMITMQELVNNNGYEWSNTLRDEGMGGFDRTELAKKLYEQSHKSYIFTNVAYTHCGGYTVNLFYGIVNAAVQGYGVCR